MELVNDDQVAQALAQLPPAPDFHTPTFGDDLGRFAHDLTQPGLGNTGRTFRAAASSAIENDIGFGISDDYVLARQYQPIVEALNKVQQRQPRSAFSNGNMIQNPFSEAARGDPHVLDDLWAQVDQERSRNPGIFGQLPKNHAEVLADAQAEQRAASDYSRQLASTGGPITGTGANFAGGALGGFADPLNIATSVIGFPASESLLKTALIEGAGNMAVDAATLPGRAQHYADIGEPMSAGDMASEVFGAGALGAGIGVGGKLLARVLGLKGHALVDEFHAQVPDPAPTLRTAAAMVEDEADRAITNPFADTAEGRDLHRQALLQTDQALSEHDPSLLPDLSEHPEIAARTAEDKLAQPIARPFDMSLEQLDAAIANEKLSDRAKLVKALGSEDAAKEFERLDRARNSMDPRRSDAASAEFDRKFGDLTPQQEYLVYGSSEDPMPSVDELKAIRAAKDHAADMADAPAPEVARVLTRGMLDITPQSARDFFESGKGSAHDQVAIIQITSALDELGRRGVSKADLDQAVVGAMTARGYSPADALDVLDGWLRLHGGRQAETANAGILPAPVGRGGVPAAAEAAADHAQHRRNADPEALKPFSDPLKKPEAFRQQESDLARELSPPPEKPISDSGKAAGGETTPSPYGDAAPQIAALERLPQDGDFADPAGSTSSVKTATAEVKRQARMVERLRACATGGE